MKRKNDNLGETEEKKSNTLLLRLKMFNKKDDIDNTVAEKMKKEGELQELGTPERIKKIGIIALALYGVGAVLFTLGVSILGGKLWLLTVLGLVCFVAYVFFHAVFCNLNARDPKFALLNFASIGIFGLIDVPIRIKRAPSLKGIYLAQIEELDRLIEKKRSELEELENELNESKQTGDNE